MPTSHRGSGQVLIVVALAVSLALSAALSGCGPKPAAVVNGEKIPASQVDAQIAQMKSQHPEIFVGAKGQELEKQFRSRIIDNLVTNILVLQAAKTNGVKVTEAEIDAKLVSMAKGFQTKEKFIAAMASSGSTLQELRDRIRTQLITQKMVDKVISKVAPTDAQARDYYRINRETFDAPPLYHVLAIKLGKGRFALAKQLIAKIKAGADFGQVSVANTVDSAIQTRSGDLGAISIDKVPNDIQVAAKKAPIGDVYGPVVTADAVWIVKVLSRTPAKKGSYASAKAQIYQILQQQLQVKAFNDWLDALKKKANVQTK
jgi:foldase protein PrsA